jgi:phosphate-selective porin OprO/OprP
MFPQRFRWRPSVATGDRRGTDKAMHRLWIPILALTVLWPGVSFAQPALKTAPTASAVDAPTPTDARLASLEAQLRQLLDDVAAARRNTGTVGARPAAEPATRTPSNAASTASPGAAADAPSIAELEERIATLDQQLRVLERKLEIEREEATARVAQTPVPVAGRDGFQVKSADGNFSVRFRGLVQADGLFFGKDSGQVATDTFLLRRVRPTFEATTFTLFDIRITPDFGGGTTVLYDAYLDARFSKIVSLRAGKFKPPIGLERLQSANDLLFVERGLPTGLVPNRDVGVMLQGELAKTRVSYQAGVFNGTVDLGLNDTDDRDGKDVVGRIFVHPFRGTKAARLQGLGLGVAGSRGRQNGTITATNLPSYRLPGRQQYFRYRSDGTVAGTTIADGSHDRWSGQGYYYEGRLGVLAEYVQSSQEIRRATETTVSTSTSWQLAGSWVLTGEANSYRGVTPKKPFESPRGYWGALELTARVNALEFDPDIFPVFVNPAVSVQAVRAWSVGANWYLNRSVKLTADYEETRFDGGAVDGDRPLERSLFTRFQFAF